MEETRKSLLFPFGILIGKLNTRWEKRWGHFEHVLKIILDGAQLKKNIFLGNANLTFPLSLYFCSMCDISVIDA